PELRVLSPAESFGPHNLHLKIDGKAELYLQSGFKKMICQRFALKADPKVWFEVFVYDMGTIAPAFAVYSQQKRADVRGLDLGAFAYGTKNALFLVHGGLYVEIIGAQADPRLEKAMVALARNLVARTKVTERSIAELGVFPPQGLERGNLLFFTNNAFGYDKFDRVFAAGYDLGGQKVTAFLSRRKDAAAAAALAQGFARFLIRNGGKAVPPPPGIPGCAAVEIAGVYEVVFSRGVFLAGVHQAENRAAAFTLAGQLYRRLGEIKP
ncbi:MAG: hypothetical protein KJ621_15855, partial [Proteobacteria bacterium]|nr:hypothetical protein [Pseudomonadota bacterium]